VTEGVYMVKILTFCAHQPFLYLFKGMRHCSFYLIETALHRRFLQNWNESVRPLPDHFHLITRDQAREGLETRQYDIALAHNVSEYVDFLPFDIPQILLFHSTLSGRILEENSGIDKQKFRKKLEQLLKRSGGTAVFISELKKRDWNIPGRIIPTAVSLKEFHGFRGEEAVILRVTNQLRERRRIFNYYHHRRIVRGFPCHYLGYNPTITGAGPAGSFAELCHYYRSHRIFLFTADPTMEDGYNLAMLEAMATGMPVVSTANPSSPVVDGVNGYMSNNLNDLRKKIDELLQNVDLARELGSQGRETVKEQFPMDKFHHSWQKVFEERLKA
jgi:glycosyltransferase involved in cell wall biosynthesis